MLASIHPLGERARGQRYPVTAGAYVAASAAGGAVMGGTLGLLGSIAFAPAEPADGVIGVLLITAALLGFGLEVRSGNGRVPSWHRQVNEDWLTAYRGWVYGAGFGFQLGLGFVTIITSATVYLTFVLAFLAHSWEAGLAIGLTFGMARAAVALTVLRVKHPGELRSAHRRLQRLAAPVQRVAAGTQAAVVLLGGMAVVA